MNVCCGKADRSYVGPLRISHTRAKKNFDTTSLRPALNRRLTIELRSGDLSARAAAQVFYALGGSEHHPDPGDIVRNSRQSRAFGAPRAHMIDQCLRRQGKCVALAERMALQ
jgi:hypothetical protein